MDRALRAMPNALGPNSPVRPPPGSLRTLLILRYSQRTRAYYRVIHGGAGRRLLHAAEHAVVAQRDNGNRTFNFSEWLGTASTVVLSNTYHPGLPTRFLLGGAARGLQHPSRHGFRRAPRILARNFPQIQTALPR